MSWIPLLCMAICGMGLDMGLPMTTTIAITMALIAMVLIAIPLTLGPGILGIWIALALLKGKANFPQ